MNTTTTATGLVGVDLAKKVFSICKVDGGGPVGRRQDLTRDAFGVWLVQRPAGTVVAMEACSGAPHWARRCKEYGRVPRLIAAQFVTPFRKRRTSKNDRNDTEAMATAEKPRTPTIPNCPGLASAISPSSCFGFYRKSGCPVPSSLPEKWVSRAVFTHAIDP